MVERKSSGNSWTAQQAYLVAALCLITGVLIGYAARGTSRKPAAAAPAVTQQTRPQLTATELAALAAKDVQPLLAKLKTQPNDSATLRQVGNIYADRQQFAEAAKYYHAFLQLEPKSIAVRGDLATCYWYMGDANAAIAEYEQALKSEPSHPGTLYNLGMVRWQGKRDYDGAVRAWEKLLAANPAFPMKAQVQEFIAQAKQHGQGKQGMLRR